MKVKWVVILSVIVIIIIILFYPTTSHRKASYTPVINPIQDVEKSFTTKEGVNFTDIDPDSFLSPEFKKPKNADWNFSGHKKLKLTFRNNRLGINIPDNDWFGSDTTQAHLFIDKKIVDSINLVFNVLPVNDAPVIHSMKKFEINEGEILPEVILPGIISDIDNRFNELKLDIGSNGKIITNVFNNRLSFFIPDKDWFGKDTISITVFDPENLNDSYSTILTVNPVNDPPVFSDIPLQVISEGERFNKINLQDYITDPDDSFRELNIECSGNKWVSAEVSGSELVIDIPDSNWFGTDTLVVTAIDKYNCTASQKIILVCNPVNDSPILSQPPNYIIDEGGIFTEIDLNIFVRDEDDSLFCWSIKTNGKLLATVDENNILRVKPVEPGWTGTDTLLITVSDNENYAETKSLFTVNRVSWINTFPAEPIKNIIITGVNDVLSLGSQFITWDSKKLIGTASVAVLTGILIANDGKFNRNILSNKTKPLNTVSKIGEAYGETVTTEITAASLSLYGIAMKDDKALKLGLEVYESYLIANSITKFLKIFFGRARPYHELGSNQFKIFPSGKVNNYALPSGHATLAFSLSAVLSSTTENNYLKGLFYIPAVATAFSRMYTNHHWASDVFLGGTIGFLVGNYIVSRHKHTESGNIIFGSDNNGGIGFRYYF